MKNLPLWSTGAGAVRITGTVKSVEKEAPVIQKLLDRNGFVFFDGAMGTMLQRAGLAAEVQVGILDSAGLRGYPDVYSISSDTLWRQHGI